MTPATRFRIKKPRVIHQTLDGEVVIINLETGNYYSLRGTGAEIWSAIERHADLEGILAALGRKNADAGDGPAGMVARFVEELQREGLIETSGQVAPESPESLTPAPDAPSGHLEAAFEPPVLEKFDDMQDLILLDPVHEIDEERGWPHPRPDAEG